MIVLLMFPVSPISECFILTYKTFLCFYHMFSFSKQTQLVISEEATCNSQSIIRTSTYVSMHIHIFYSHRQKKRFTVTTFVSKDSVLIVPNKSVSLQPTPKNTSSRLSVNRKNLPRETINFRGSSQVHLHPSALLHTVQ